ncbi:replication protein A 70 kDa DNA-binding subunit B-like [Primulina huaijiensis]|uniref:replication protein A 70 kDa DNA-binding subunit B-like n=1 Tax=Primulina huaijiensis TaxID=1492673 RepID=UPI003CC76E88
MEEKCTTFRNLELEAQSWFVKVLVAEKTPIRFLRWGRLVFVDKENERMQSIIYDQDVDQLDKLLDLYKTYYVGNAKIREITGNTPILATSKHQMILSRSTYIRRTEEHERIPIEHIYQLTSFVQLPELADVPTRQINYLCSVIHVFPPRFVERTKRNLQDFVIVKEERRPLILTLWEEFLQSEAPYLKKNVHNMPIVLGMRLSVNTFYGLSIGTIPSSTILFDPPISEAEDL